MPIPSLRRLAPWLVAAALSLGLLPASAAATGAEPALRGLVDQDEVATETVDAVKERVAVTSECATRQAQQTFAFLGDENWYFLAPGGDFEAESPPWSLNGLATIVQRLEYTDFFGGGTLKLRHGGVAISPAFCVDRTMPHLRAGVRSEHDEARLRFEAIVDGERRTLAWLGGEDYVDGGASPFVRLADLLHIAPGASKQVQLRIAAYEGTWLVDGVSIDPKTTR